MNQDRQVLRYEAGHQMGGMRNMADRQMFDRHMSRMDGRQYSDMNMADRQMSGHQYSDMADRQMSDMRMGNQQMSGMRMGDQQMSGMRMGDQQMSGMSMADRQMSGHQYADRQMSGMRMGNQQMSGRQQQQQVVDFPQYFKQDDSGNYAYGYSSGVSERYEVGNPQSGVKGHYTYVDSNGLHLEVEYVADDQGFRIVGKDEQPHQQHSRFTRSVEPDMMRMTSYYLMESPALMDDDMLQMQRGMYRNGMSLNNNRRMFDNVISGNRQMYDGRMLNRQMANRQMTDRQMAGRHMFDREMSRDNMMYRNMMNDAGRQMSDRRMFDREMSANHMLNGNRVFGLYTMDNAFDKMNMDNMRIGDGVLGEQSSLSQRMEIERIPTDNTNVMSYRMF